MSSYLRDRIEQWWHSLDRGQQISLSFLAPCSAVTIILAAVSLQSSIVMPFRAPKTLLQNSQALISRQRAEAEAREQSNRVKDTDGDGILDQDEVGVFRTSPYLSDTDSDGVADGEEIRAGTDPNCPPDRDCYGFIEMNADAVPEASASQPTPPNESPTTLIEPPKPPEELSPSEIRAYLIRVNLAAPEQVNALPDEGVVELYRRAYNELRAVQSARPSSSPSP